MKQVTIPKRSPGEHVFLSPTEPRLRAGWRLLIQTLLMVALITILSISIGIVGLFVAIGQKVRDGLMQLVVLIAITASIFLARKFLDRRTISSLGLDLNRRTWADLLAGIGISGAMIALVYLLMHTFGWLTFNGFAWQTHAPKTIILNLIWNFVFFIAVGWQEELMSRGYHLQTIASGINLPWGVFLSSAFFGILHLGNPNADEKWMISLCILLAGLFLAYAYLRTRQLWLAIGLHIGWNFFQGPVFGFPVSGTGATRLLDTTVTGPTLITGGNFGPESGLIILPVLLLGTLLIYLYTRGHKPATMKE